ncbi:tyrosine-type recombinase/integrase [Streptomyces luteolifulvus]|uniref:Tyrosine-type recombinase/integrase n=1 Tax=Streptomyces luteolifulvus TaxID=2615112 RepID=A0A6H9UNC7_9ACTN|nr:tyrosine-type recombinase/integrase [Streptomyces luteolifulvus]KAB1139576.1 tyrosine-type recombinase/integrase [Streptomyces luteolifulvus]
MNAVRPPLRALLADYLTVRRALGFKLAAVGRILGQFVDFLEDAGIDTVTVDAALAFAQMPDPDSTNWPAIRLSAVRRFAIWLRGIDPACQVPSARLLRHGPDRATPYLYSPQQIDDLLTQAGRLRPALRAATYQTLIGTLASSGIRIGEAIALDDADLDVERSLLIIREAKFGKSRLVPLHATALTAVAAYRELREASVRRQCPALFVSTVGTRLHHSNITLTYHRLTAAAGITPRSDTCRPRIHDLRHSFAVATVLDWYAAGADVPAMLPRLATFLGHTDPKHTYWYLSAAPELMVAAADRLDAYLDGAP